MTKFEEELRKIKQHRKYLEFNAGITYWYRLSELVQKFGNWHSDEEFQEIATKLTFAEEEIEELSDKIGQLKSQLQQQALPVVPECVGEWIEYVKGKNNNALALLDDDNMPDDVNEWLFFQRNDDNINLILRAWLDGYTVQKPKRFYLKNKLTTSYLALENKTGYYCHISPITESSYWKASFTQEDIEAMEDTGSYEKIEVVK